jgi:DNA polymerase-3 subunit gamma/tau
MVATQEMSKRLDSLRIPLEISLVRLAHDKKNQAPVVNLPEKEVPAKESKTAHVSKKAEVSPEPPPTALSITLDNIKEGWGNIIENLSRIKMSVATYMNEGEPFKLQGNILTIAFPKNYSLHKESLESKENKEIIEKNISQLFNENLRVNFVLSAEAKQPQDSGSSPFIKSALDMFNGRLIKED